MDRVLLIGFDTDSSVLKTAFDLFEGGEIEPVVISDLVGSHTGEAYHATRSAPLPSSGPSARIRPVYGDRRHRPFTACPIGWGTVTASRPRLVAFDLDDTLAPSKSAIDPRIGRQLIALAERVEVAIISGGQLGQFRAQVVDLLPEASTETLTHIHLLPTCGTQYYRLRDGGIETVYAHSLTDDEKSRALGAVEEEARRLGLWESETWGDILEDRGSQITFSALGQRAPLDAKVAWDPTGEKKNALREAVAARIPDLEVRSGGSTSVDITHRGIDKAYGMRQLAAETGIPLDDMLFVGDRLDPDGNDYPVLAMGVTCHAVEGWPDTAEYLDALLPALPLRQLTPGS